MSAAWSSQLSDIASVHVHTRVYGMHSSSFGSDYIAEFTLTALMTSGHVGNLPHGNTTVTVTAHHTDGQAIYRGSTNQLIGDAVTAITVAMEDLNPDAAVDQGNVCPFFTTIAVSPMRLTIGAATEVEYAGSDLNGDALTYAMSTVFDASTSVVACPGKSNCFSITAGADEPLGAKAVSLQVTDGTCPVTTTFDTVVAQKTSSQTVNVYFKPVARSLASTGTAVRVAGDTLTVTVVLEDTYVAADSPGTVNVIDTCDVSGATTTDSAYTSETVTIPHAYKGEATGEMCTAVYTFINSVGRASDPVTFTYYSGGVNEAYSYAPAIDFAFVSDTDLKNGDQVTLVAIASSQDSVPIAGSFVLSSAFATLDSSTTDTAAGHFTATYIVTDEDNIGTAAFTATAYSLDTVKTFYLNTATPTYTTQPTPAPACTFPPVCAAGQIGSTSLNAHVYVGSVTHTELPPGSVIAIQATDASMFQSDLTIDVAHAIANCGEIEARVDSVTLNANKDIYHMQLDDFYYDGQWDYGSGLVTDSGSLPSPVSFRIVSAPQVATGQGIQLHDCNNGGALYTTLVMLQHYAFDEDDLPCMDRGGGGSFSALVVNLTDTCYVGFSTWDDTACSTTLPIRLPCMAGTCQGYEDHYLAADPMGDITVFSDSSCTVVLGTLPTTGSLDMKATSPGLAGTYSHYASEMFPVV